MKDTSKDVVVNAAPPLYTLSRLNCGGYDVYGWCGEWKRRGIVGFHFSGCIYRIIVITEEQDRRPFTNAAPDHTKKMSTPIPGRAKITCAGESRIVESPLRFPSSYPRYAVCMGI